MELLKKAAAQKTYLFQKSNGCVKAVTLKNCEEVASPNKAIKLS